MAISKADLLKVKVDTRVYVVEGVGEVKYRGLTRGEAVGLQGKQMDASAMDRKLLATAVVDPKLTEEEWGEVADATPAGLLSGLSEAIAEASGMRVADAKAAYAQFREQA